jgi:hypothetical protein
VHIKRKQNLLIICLMYLFVGYGACRSAQDLEDNKGEGNTPHNMPALLAESVSREGGDLRLIGGDPLVSNNPDTSKPIQRTLPLLRKEGSRKDVYIPTEPEEYDHDLVTGKNQGSQKRFSQKRNRLQQQGSSRRNLNSEGRYQDLSPRKGNVSPREKDLKIKKIVITQPARR